jgi:hypothetical protein
MKHPYTLTSLAAGLGSVPMQSSRQIGANLSFVPVVDPTNLVFDKDIPLNDMSCIEVFQKGTSTR